MDAYEQMMTGMTMDEVRSWFGDNFSGETGKPQSDSISGATMSLRGEHGDILLAIERAWEDAQRRQGPTKVDTNTVTDATQGEDSMS
jgi:hypothetical protein